MFAVNKEKNVLYISKRDIRKIAEMEIPLEFTIYSNFKEYIPYALEKNKVIFNESEQENKMIRFDGENYVKAIQSIKWLVDRDDCLCLSKAEWLEKKEKLLNNYGTNNYLKNYLKTTFIEIDNLLKGYYKNIENPDKLFL